MTRRALLFGFLVVTGLGWTIACARRGVARNPRTSSVRVTIQCVNDSIWIAVDPWTVRLVQGDTTEWELTQQSTPNEIVVSQKPTGPPWPYPPTSRVASKAQPGRSGAMRPNVPHQRYTYTITAICTQEGRIDTLVIDPDMDWE